MRMLPLASNKLGIMVNNSNGNDEKCLSFGILCDQCMYCTTSLFAYLYTNEPLISPMST